MRLLIESIANGGAGVARHEGKVVFVEGGLVGDVVEAVTIEDKGRFEKAAITEVLERSPSRIEPPCPLFGICGGCMWQHAAYPDQLEWKRQILVEQIHRIGRLEPVVRPVIAPGEPYGYRNRMDFSVVDGKPVLRKRGSHSSVVVERCLLLDSALIGLTADADSLQGSEFTLRAGIGTGEVAAIGAGRHPSISIESPATAVIHERVGDKTFQISGRAFFQVNTWGAEVLVRLVKEAAGLSEKSHLVDMYAGGGLFAATVGSEAGRVTAVEWNCRAIADLSVNAPGVHRIDVPVESSFPEIKVPADVVVVDPPRVGLGRKVVEGILGLSPETVIYVSCDPGSFARDARLLAEGGLDLDSVQPVDMFPQTPHIEVVGVFKPRV